MSETCDTTPKGIDCLLCGKEGSWDRPTVTFDDWYPKPPCPEPLPDEMSWFVFALFMILFCIVCFGLGNLIATGHIF